MAQRPNLLVLLTDQHSADALSCAGHPWLHTPALDRLAARGVRFERAVCAYPMCVPSRSSLFYGRPPHELLHPGTEIAMNPDLSRHGVRPAFTQQQLALLLGAHGYDCAYAGKWHVGTWGPTESLPDGPHPHGFRKLSPIQDAATTDAACAFLQHPDTAREHPFLLVASFDNPHNIHEFAIDQSLPQGHLPPAPALPDLPPLPANFAPASEEPANLRQWRAQNDARHAFSAEDWRRYRWVYFRLVEKVDAQLGRILDALDASPHAANTLVLFTSDHGEMQGAHGLPYKQCFYDEAVRVPLILAGPGVASPGRTTPALASGLDVFPTLCAAAGLPAPPGLRGLSLLPFLQNPTHSPDRPAVFSEFNRHGVRGHFVASPQFNYSVWEQGPLSEQLFDRAADPGEMVNLAGLSRYRDTLQEHRELLRAWLAATDTSFAGGHYAWPATRRLLPGDSYA